MNNYMIVFATLLLTCNTELSTFRGIQSLPQAAPTIGRIRGTVISNKGINLPGATVIFESSGTQYKVETDSNGLYEIEVPGGAYQVSTEMQNYFPFRRASFRVKPNTTIVINVCVEWRYKSVGSGYDPSTDKLTDFSIGAVPSLYETLHPIKAPSEILIRFDQRRKHRNTIEYTRVMISNDLLVIHADKARVDPKTFQFQIEGNVIVENDKQRLYLKQARLDFEQGAPHLKPYF